MAPTAIPIPQLCDALAIVIVGVFAFVGTAHGALRGISRIVAFLAALTVGRFAAPVLGAPIERILHIETTSAQAVGWVVVTLVVLAALGVCLHRLDPWIREARIPVVDPILGLVLGIAFGAALVIAGVLATLSSARPQSPLREGLAVSRSGAISRRVNSSLKPIFQKVGF
jgi:uncharacterized membrane protein required for colicin V production